MEKIDYGTHVSFEVFPPKKDDEFENVYNVLDAMSVYQPEFISVTYGAGGSRSKKTVEIATYIKEKLNIPTIAHITCVGNKAEDIDAVLTQLDAAGLDQVLALRGDRPAWMTDEQFESRDFAHASDLITYILSKNPNMKICAACYPEKHYQADSFEEDLENLKRKADLGCTDLITQLFLDNSCFYRFQDMVAKKGITAPVHAGIMPITSIKMVDTSISLSGTSVPKEFSDIIARYSDNKDDFRKAGIDFAIKQIEDLRDHGVYGIHLYSMNKPKTTGEILSAIAK